MNTIITTLQTMFSSYFSVLSWRDFIEIGALSTAFYYSALWLKKDRQKNLLPYFYGYVTLIIVCHFGELNTLTSFLFIFSPAVAMLFMLMHQELLQRNLVMLKNITTHPSPSCPDWLASIMKATLSMLAENKDIILLIEHTDAMNPFLQLSDTFEAPITDGLISLLFQKLYTPSRMCWLTSSGMIRGINVSFKASWHPTAYHTKTAWIDDAVAYTAKADALIIFANAQLHNYAVAHSGIIRQGLSMEQAHQLIKKLINYQISLPKKGLSHGVFSTKKYAHHAP